MIFSSLAPVDAEIRKNTGGTVVRQGVQPARIEVAGLTDAGLVRSDNEDSLFITDQEGPNAFGASGFGLYLIADGMGGHKGGEVASNVATRAISEHVIRSLKAPTNSRSPGDLLKQSVELANREILDIASANRELRSMGTTVTAALRLDFDLYLAHVGDSRAYLVRQGSIRQLTNDHSVIARLLTEERISAEQARTHPDRGKIYRSLGPYKDVIVDTGIRGTDDAALRLTTGDALVFCSDGLTDLVSDDEILRQISRPRAAVAICKDLVGLANQRGGMDNTSVVVVRVDPT